MPFKVFYAIATQSIWLEVAPALLAVRLWALRPSRGYSCPSVTSSKKKKTPMDFNMGTLKRDGSSKLYGGNYVQFMAPQSFEIRKNGQSWLMSVLGCLILWRHPDLNTG
jgi:hypothetical protein